MIGRLFKFIILATVLGAAGMVYYMYQNDLNPLNTDDLEQAVSSTKSRFENIQDAVKASGGGKESVIYKRKDTNGNWYYTNEPPAKGEKSEKLIYRSDANVLPPLPEDGKKPD